MHVKAGIILNCVMWGTSIQTVIYNYCPVKPQ